MTFIKCQRDVIVLVQKTTKVVDIVGQVNIVDSADFASFETIAKGLELFVLTSTHKVLITVWKIGKEMEAKFIARYDNTICNSLIKGPLLKYLIIRFSLQWLQYFMCISFDRYDLSQFL